MPASIEFGPSIFDPDAPFPPRAPGVAGYIVDRMGGDRLDTPRAVAPDAITAWEPLRPVLYELARWHLHPGVQINSAEVAIVYVSAPGVAPSFEAAAHLHRSDCPFDGLATYIAAALWQGVERHCS